MPVYANRDRVTELTGIVIKSSLGLSVIAVGYVLAASTNNLFWKTAVFAFIVICFGVIRANTDLLTDANTAFAKQSRDSSIYELLLVVSIALILRGWSHLIFLTVPIFLSLLMKSKVPEFRIGERGLNVLRGFFWIAIFIGSWAVTYQFNQCHLVFG